MRDLHEIDVVGKQTLRDFKAQPSRVGSLPAHADTEMARRRGQTKIVCPPYQFMRVRK